MVSSWRCAAGAVVEQKAVAVGGEHERNVECRGVVERLLHAVADGVVVVLGFDERDGDVRLVIEDVVGALGLAAGDQLAADDDAAFGEADLPANLRGFVPPGLYDGGGDVLGADVGFAERLLVRHSLHKVVRRLPSLRESFLLRVRTTSGLPAFWAGTFGLR